MSAVQRRHTYPIGDRRVNVLRSHIEEGHQVRMQRADLLKSQSHVTRLREFLQTLKCRYV